jgi:hypothetical protein
MTNCQFSMPNSQLARAAFHPAQEAAFGDGKDAFHRVPFIPGKVRDAVERVLTMFGGAQLGAGAVAPGVAS